MLARAQELPTYSPTVRCTVILRGLSAIMTKGLTTTWNHFTHGTIDPINIRTRETIAVTSSRRNKALTGCEHALTHHIVVERGRNVSPMAPEVTEWTLDELINWIQHLPAEDVDKFPEPDFSIPLLGAFNRALVTHFGQKMELLPGRSFVASVEEETDLIRFRMPGYATGRFCNANDVLRSFR